MKQLRISQLFFSYKTCMFEGLKPYKNKGIALSAQNIHVNHLSIFDKYFYFFVKHTCQKEKEVLQCF